MFNIMLVPSVYSYIFRECICIYSLNDQERSFPGMLDVQGGFGEGNELIPQQCKPYLTGTTLSTS